MAAYSIRDEYQYPEFDKAGIDNYIKNRLLYQIEWYDRKSGNYQKKYKRISILTVTLNGQQASGHSLGGGSTRHAGQFLELTAPDR